MNQNNVNFHVQYLNITSQHWSYSSEKYAGGDHLLTALERGWEVSETVKLERHWFAGMRCIEIYHFTIQRGDKTIDMPVVNNPYVTRFISTYNMKVIELEGKATA